MLLSLLSFLPVIAQTTSEVVTFRAAPSDSINLTIPPTAPSLRPEDAAIVHIGTPSPLTPGQPATARSALLPAAEEPRNMNEFFGSQEGLTFRTATDLTLQPHRQTRTRLALLVGV